jgi:hypothetical protein
MEQIRRHISARPRLDLPTPTSRGCATQERRAPPRRYLAAVLDEVRDHIHAAVGNGS